MRVSTILKEISRKFWFKNKRYKIDACIELSKRKTRKNSSSKIKDIKLNKINKLICYLLATANIHHTCISIT